MGSSIPFKNGGQRKIKKYLHSAEPYDYESRKNYDLGLTLRGLAVDPAQRLTEYVNSAVERLNAKIEDGTLDLEQARSWLNVLREATVKLQSLADALEKYAREHEDKETEA